MGEFHSAPLGEKPYGCHLHCGSRQLEIISFFVILGGSEVRHLNYTHYSLAFVPDLKELCVDDVESVRQWQSFFLARVLGS